MESRTSATDKSSYPELPVLDEARDRLGGIAERAAEFIREQPGTSLLIAVAVGFVLGRLLRA
jgi:ElaB/YqjD/DUF883 family membrane-anchored ribosome-binding protein